MTFFEAILLGLLQGITEFFPISSSGHLIIGEQLLGVETDYSVLYSIILHIGTLCAVLLVFKKDIKKLFFSALGILNDIRRNCVIFYKNLFVKQEKKYYRLLRTSYRKLFVLLLFSMFPSALLGIFFRAIIVNYASSLLLTGLGFLVTGLLLFVSEYTENGHKNLKNTTWSNALMIGACQGFSVIPGISRFGMTLTVGLFSGLDKSFAVKYSFLLAIPTMVGVTVYELIFGNLLANVSFGMICSCIAGAIIAGFAGFFTIKIFLNIVRRGRLRWISYYCLTIGILVIIMNLI